MSSLYILATNPLFELLFANIFSHLIGCLLVLLVVSFGDGQQIYEKMLNFSSYEGNADQIFNEVPHHTC